MIKTAENDDFRRGPSPFPVHMGLAMAEYTRMQQAGEISPKDLENMLAGIKKYQNHPFRRQMDPLPVMWESGEVKIYHAGAKNAAASLLLVPSLINKSFILDLLPDRSFVRWLAAQGIDAYLLDWGNSVADDGQTDMASLIDGRLRPAIRAVAEQAGGPVHALGYCMGGTLLAAAAAQEQEHLSGAVFLASPWDFAAGDRKLAEQVKMGTPAALQVIDSKGHLPMDWIQSVFAAVNASRAMKKFNEFAKLDDDSDEAALFVAVEDWLNDGVDMPGALAKCCVQDWYGNNEPGQGKWQVGGRAVSLPDIQTPCLVVASLNDRLVPKDSSLAMAALLPHATVLEPSSGHIGMMTGRRAAQQVWEPVADWVKTTA